MPDFQENPRTLAEILEAEQEFFDRGLVRALFPPHPPLRRGSRADITEAQYKVSQAAQTRVRARRPDVRLCESDFEWGTWNVKLSTLRWVLGSEWDFLDI
jgi:hypothetical protein